MLFQVVDELFQRDIARFVNIGLSDEFLECEEEKKNEIDDEWPTRLMVRAHSLLHNFHKSLAHAALQLSR